MGTPDDSIRSFLNTVSASTVPPLAHTLEKLSSIRGVLLSPKASLPSPALYTTLLTAILNTVLPTYGPALPRTLLTALFTPRNGMAESTLAALVAGLGRNASNAGPDVGPDANTDAMTSATITTNGATSNGIMGGNGSRVGLGNSGIGIVGMESSNNIGRFDDVEGIDRQRWVFCAEVLKDFIGRSRCLVDIVESGREGMGLLLSLPDRIANLGVGLDEGVLREEPLARLLVIAAGGGGCGKEDYGWLVSRLVLRGLADVVASVIVPSNTSLDFLATREMAMPHVLSSFVCSLLEARGMNPARLESLFENSSMKLVLTSKLPLGSSLSRRGRLLLVKALALSVPLLLECMRRVAATWGLPAFIASSLPDHHIALSLTLAASLAAIASLPSPSLPAPLLELLLDGTQAHIADPRAEIRALGFSVAHHYSKILGAEKSIEDPGVLDLTLETEESSVWEYEENVVHGKEQIDLTAEDEDEDEDDFDAPATFSFGTGGDGDDDDEDSSSSSSCEFEPYSMPLGKSAQGTNSASPEVQLPKVPLPRPLYLAQAVKWLRPSAKNTPEELDNFEGALVALPELVKSLPYDLPVHAPKAVTILLGASSVRARDSFEAERYNGLLTLGEYSDEALSAICGAFYSSSRTLKQRADVLMLVRDVTQKRSKARTLSEAVTVTLFYALLEKYDPSAPFLTQLLDPTRPSFLLHDLVTTLGVLVEAAGALPCVRPLGGHLLTLVASLTHLVGIEMESRLLLAAARIAGNVKLTLLRTDVPHAVTAIQEWLNALDTSASADPKTEKLAAACFALYHVKRT